LHNYSLKKKKNRFIKYIHYKHSALIKKEIFRFKADLIILGSYKFCIKKIFNKNDNIFYWLEKPELNTVVKKILKKLYYFLKFKRINKVFTVGSESLSYFRKFNLKKIINMPYAINLDHYQKKNYKNNKGKINFLYIGQLIERKGVIEMIDAFKKINKNLNCQLNIVGEGVLKEKLINLNKKNSRINFLNFMSQKKLIKFMYKNDILILPSKFDGWGVVVNQAFAAGMPVIGSKNAGAVNDYVVNNRNGLIINDISKYSIYSKIKFYIDNPYKIIKHGKYARKKIEKSLLNIKNSIKSIDKAF